MNDVVVLKGNTKFNKGLVMPKEGTYLELTQDEMEYVDGGWFAGIRINSEVCTWVYNRVLTMVITGGTFMQGVSGLISALSAKYLGFAAIVGKITGTISALWAKFTSFLLAHPVVYVAVLAAGAIAAGTLAGMIVAGSYGRGFQSGIENFRPVFGLY